MMHFTYLCSWVPERRYLDKLKVALSVCHNKKTNTIQISFTYLDVLLRPELEPYSRQCVLNAHGKEAVLPHQPSHVTKVAGWTKHHTQT